MKSVEFKSFDKVLVRNSKTEEWKCRLLDRMFCGKFLCQDGLVYKYCLPYNGNTEYLVGKSEFYEKKMGCKDSSWKQKDGDFVTYTFTQTNNNTYKVIMVCKLLNESTAFNYISYNSYDKSVMSYKSPMNQRLCKVNDLKPATEEEKQLLLDKSREAGLNWDAEKKEVVIYRWKPKHSEVYYFIDSNGTVCCRNWYNTVTDTDFYYIKNCFKTIKEAEEMAERIKKVLKG